MYDESITRVKASLCPYCGYKTDSLSDMDGKDKPKPDDLTVCINCCAICVLDKNLMSRKPFNNEIKRAYAEHPELVHHIKEIQRAIKTLPKRDPKLNVH